MVNTPRFALATLAVAIVASLEPPAGAVVPPPPLVVTAASDLPPPADARRLCGQSVAGTGMHVVWSLYAVRRAPEAVVAEYVRRFGAPSYAGDGRHVTVRNASRLVLQIYPASELTQRPQCGTGPATGEATLVMVSQASP